MSAKKQKTEKKIKHSSAKKVKKTAKEKTLQENIELDFSETLMPELEELVKKNPNRLVGCGG